MGPTPQRRDLRCERGQEGPFQSPGLPLSSPSPAPAPRAPEDLGIPTSFCHSGCGLPRPLISANTLGVWDACMPQTRPRSRQGLSLLSPLTAGGRAAGPEGSHPGSGVKPAPSWHPWTGGGLKSMRPQGTSWAVQGPSTPPHSVPKSAPWSLHRGPSGTLFQDSLCPNGHSFASWTKETLCGTSTAAGSGHRALGLWCYLLRM